MLRFSTRPVDKMRFKKALRLEPHEEIPYFEMEFTPAKVSAILGKPVNCTSLSLPALDYLKFLQCVGIDLAYLHVAWPLGRKEYIDKNGRRHYLDGIIKNKNDLKQIVIPDLSTIKRRIEEFLEAADGTNIGWMYALPSPENIMTAVGPQDYYISLLENPSFIDEFLDIYEAYSLPVTDLVLDYKPDAILLASSVCYKSGPIMNPESAERFIFSRIKKQMSLVLSAGIPAVIHSDGDNSKLMHKWIELGFSGFNPVEPCENFDIYETKRLWGDKIALIGNIDVAGVLSFGSPDEVYQDTMEHLCRLSPNGGYICGSSHDISDFIPLENVEAMIKAVCDFKQKTDTVEICSRLPDVTIEETSR